MKRIILAWILILTLLLGVGCQNKPSTKIKYYPTDTKEEEDIPQNLVMRFAAISDIHIGAENTEESFRRTLRYLNTYAQGVPLDAIVVSGDLTDTTGGYLSEDQISLFKKIYEEEITYDTSFIYSLGPGHDVPYYEPAKEYRDMYIKVLGEEYFANDLGSTENISAGVRHIMVKDHHFFTLDYEGDPAGMPQSAVDWLTAEIDAAAQNEPNKPFFLSTHVPDDQRVNALLSKYPQAVCLTGHLHNSVAREDSITQDKGYTNLHCGGVNYYRVDGYNRFTEDPYLKLGDITEFAQALYIEVFESGHVQVSRLDTYNGAQIGEKWLITPKNYSKYTEARFEGENAGCRFADDAKLGITVIGNSYVNVAFDPAQAGAAGPAQYYMVELLQPMNGSYMQTQHAELSSQQVFFPNDEEIPTLHYSHLFKGVNTADFAVVVTAYDCRNASQNTLLYTNGGYGENSPGVIYSYRDLTEEEQAAGIVLEEAQDVEFDYGPSDNPSVFTKGYTMAVRFQPAVDFTNVKFRCSSWGDLNGTLEFKMYKWAGDYDSSVAGEVIETYTLESFKGSTVYSVFSGIYSQGEYLIEVTSPDPDNGVGLYYYPLLENQGAYVSYTNKGVMSDSIYLSWTNTVTAEEPYIPIYN